MYALIGSLALNTLAPDITLIGAGLAGALLGIRLAQKGFRVDIFERFPHYDDATISGGRSINLALAERGRKALTDAGLIERIDAFAIPMRGRMLHNLQGETQLQRYSQHDNEVIYSVHRDRLNSSLIEAAAEHDNITMYFNHRLVSVDYDKNQLHLIDDRSGDERTHAFTTLIGCDGAGSALRQSMQQQQTMHVDAQMLDHGYCELTIPAHSDGSPQLDLQALHVWPRGGFMLIALPNPDHSFTATLFLAHDGTPGFQQINQPQELISFLAEQFPDVYPLFSKISDDLSDYPIGELGTLNCYPWHFDGQALLLGDAAHAIVPFHGQGMNAAFEDITLLLQLIDEQTEGIINWADIYRQFSQQRKPDTDAIATLALENYWIMRDAVRDPLFHVKKILEWELEQRFPEYFIPRYCQVMFRHIPYAQTLQRGVIQNDILDELLMGTEKPSDGLAHIDWGTAAQLIHQRLTKLTTS